MSKNFNWKEKLLDKYFHKIDTQVISTNFKYLHSIHRYSLRFLLAHIPKLDITKFDRIQHFPEAVYNEYLHIWTDNQWLSTSQNPQLSVGFIRRHQSILNWHDISKNCTPTDAFIREFELKIQWPEMMENPKLPDPIKQNFLRRIQRLGRIK